jgi:hypothetical protein
LKIKNCLRRLFPHPQPLSSFDKLNYRRVEKAFISTSSMTGEGRKKEERKLCGTSA